MIIFSLQPSLTVFLFEALPDNLKLLFRPVAMTTPEFGLIAEVFLYSVGFIKVGEMMRIVGQCKLLFRPRVYPVRLSRRTDCVLPSSPRYTIMITG